MKFSYIPKQLTSEELHAYEKYVSDAYSNADVAHTLRKELYIATSNFTPEQFFPFRETYLRWYSTIAWKRLRSLDVFELQHVLQHTFFLAILQEQKILDKLVSWLAINTSPYSDRGVVYDKMIRDTILSSQEVVYMENGKPFTIEKLVQEVIALDNKDSLAQAEYFSKFEKRIALELKKSYFNDRDINAIVLTLIGLLKTFIAIEKENIHSMVLLLESPERFFETLHSLNKEERAEALGIPPEEKPTESQVEMPTQSEKSAEIPQVETVAVDFPQELGLHKHDFALWILEEDTLALLLSWMKSFGSADIAHAALATELKQNLPQELDDETATMLLQVDTFLRNNNFGSKKDMVYFNEETGTFSWS
ncbi:MAG: hypothetical protein CL685_00240 [Candidatus Magasanikbacteria bacterium]|nr:hypothetical protein [Candidatus Magasanikbacteria bacterium]|tara:strand:+ start:9406 stop:10500 length:1095 start_codon:yes stop_codon:yes gene_type:complete